MKSPHEVWWDHTALQKVNRSTSVLIGFASLLLLMGVLVVDSGRNLRQLASASAALRKEYRERDNLLDRLRTDVYHASTLIRDYLLEPGNAAAEDQRTELKEVQQHSRATLMRYGQMAQGKEQEGFRILNRSAESYWLSLAPALDWKGDDKQHLGETFLRETVIPRRNALIDVVRQANALNQRDMESGEQRVSALVAQVDRRMTVISLLALLVGTVLAIVVLLHVYHLEGDATRRFDEAQEEERRNLSRELHDEIGQAMSAMLMEVGRLETRLTGKESELLASVRRMAEDTVAKVRDLSLLLRPSMLDELGLVPALRWHAREVSRRTGLKVKMIAGDIEQELPEVHRTCVYRIVQEALHNCVRHSGASEVRVVMQHGADGLRVTIRDDGIGFDRKREKGLGLLGISERVRALGGRFEIESRPRQGTTLSAFFPLAPAPGSPARKEVA